MNGMKINSGIIIDGVLHEMIELIEHFKTKEE